MATSYTEELKAMLEEVTLRGNPNKKDVAKICSVLFRMNERLNDTELEMNDLREEIKVLKATVVKPARPTAQKTKATEETTKEE